VLVLLGVGMALFYLSASDLGVSLNLCQKCYRLTSYQGFNLSLGPACCSSWAAAKKGLFESGQTFQRALKFSVRACYSFLKRVAITLYEFLEEEQPTPHADTIGLTFIDSAVTQGEGSQSGSAIELGTTQGNGLQIGDVLEKQGSYSLDGIALPTQAENAFDLATSTGFLSVESDIPVATSTGFLRVESDIPAVGDVSSSLFGNGMTTDVVVRAGTLP
jgi:hypothetical protein